MSELDIIRKIDCLSITLKFLPDNLTILLYFQHNLSGFPSGSRLLFICFLLVIVGATDVLCPKRPCEMRSSSLAVKVIHRRVHERTIEKTIHIYISPISMEHYL